MVYVSPEMALSDSFLKLWKDTRFRGRLTALIVDEAHCIEDWGSDDFRPLYRKLDILRNYTGFEIPFFACTATCRTSTFDLIWDTLTLQPHSLAYSRPTPCREGPCGRPMMLDQ